MESIEIKGFLTIDYAHFEIKKINILIGAQAQGKSVIAKLVYFFRHYFFIDIFVNSCHTIHTKREIDKKLLENFELLFPSVYWSKTEFSIIYSYGIYNISIIKSSDKSKIKFAYSKEITNLLKRLRTAYYVSSEKFESVKKHVYSEDESSFIEFSKNLKTCSDVSKKAQKITDTNLFVDSIFIPANRSFFAILQKNIFSFLANDIYIDPLIKEFGLFYESLKKIIKNKNIFNEKNNNKINSLINEIIAGEYIYAKEQDWIYTKEEKFTNLIHASSGQQESLPMLLILKIFSIVYGKENTTAFFIEEPEAHLFPTSQKKIVSLIATLYNNFGHSFFITTHSPYILTAINNLVVGKDAYDKAEGNTEKLKRIEQVFAFDELICLEDVSAYTLNKGKLESIINMENRLIGANLLDAVSDEFDEAFGVATDILYGGE